MIGRRIRGSLFAIGAIAIAIAALLLAGCRSADVVNHCLQADGNCPPCASNADCGFSGNPCNDVVACVHRDVPLAHTDLGCDAAIEYSWPDPEECACVASVCRYADE